MKVLLSLLLALFVFAPVTPIRSQQATQSGQLSIDPTPVNRLKSDYFFHLEKYRDTKEQFIVDQAEHEKLATLATQEKLVVSYRTVLTARAKTLRTYLYPLKQLLIDSQGIDVADKQKAISQIDSTLGLINPHIQTLTSLVERDQLIAEAERFETQDLPVFQEASYRGLSLLSIGRIQAVTDQVIVSIHNFEQEVVNYEKNARRQDAMKRGLKEVNLLYSYATEAIGYSRTSFATFDAPQEDIRDFTPQGVYDQIIDQLNPAYTNLHRALDYLIELDKNQ